MQIDPKINICRECHAEKIGIGMNFETGMWWFSTKPYILYSLEAQFVTISKPFIKIVVGLVKNAINQTQEQEETERHQNNKRDKKLQKENIEFGSKVSVKTGNSEKKMSKEIKTPNNPKIEMIILPPNTKIQIVKNFLPQKISQNK